MDESWSEKDEIICMALYMRKKAHKATLKDIECISRLLGKKVEIVQRKLEKFELLEEGKIDLAISNDLCKKMWLDFK